ncbi:MAG: phosphatidylglycerol lysyltransferase domain-containing protein [Alistipes sp.]|nr:phosphatidylglycerol lysyltransferase domain-containing protein [Alistipes sp.]
MLEFKKITIKDGKRLKPYLKSDGQYACEFTFGNNVLWNVDGLLEYVITEETLIYRLMYKDKIVYCVPDFRGKVKSVLDKIGGDAQSREMPYCITCLSEEMVGQIKDAAPNRFAFSFDDAHSDYIYPVEKLASLSGKKLHKKKNHWNQFMKNYAFTYEAICAKNTDDCRKMKEKWFELRFAALEKEGASEEEKNSLVWEAKTLDTALEHFEEFEFTGGLIRVDGEVLAFTLGEPVNDETFVVHFEKAYGDVNGLYTTINQQFVEHELLGKYRYVNREEDMGLPGLRKAKMSYYPEFLYEKWVAVPTEC